MSVNKHLAHIFVLPEDDANRQIANGFYLDVSTRQVQVLSVAGGWIRVLESFKTDHINKMDEYPGRFMVLLIDFDGRRDRLDTAKSFIPSHLLDRVLVLGVWKDPEALRTRLGRSYEQIGQDLAKECRDERQVTWGDDLLRHNTSEIDRVRDRLRPILFPT